MNIQENDDFKYIVQDTNCLYIGKELTYAEMMEREDVPFKLKAIISAYLSKDTDLNTKMTEHILNISSAEFSYRIFEQLKMTVRVCYKTQKRGLGGRIKEKWVHKVYPFGRFCSECRDKVRDGSMMLEDLSISKLALMAISI